jgi:uncharacterized membrane protein
MNVNFFKHYDLGRQNEQNYIENEINLDYNSLNLMEFLNKNKQNFIKNSGTDGLDSTTIIIIAVVSSVVVVVSIIIAIVCILKKKREAEEAEASFKAEEEEKAKEKAKIEIELNEPNQFHEDIENRAKKHNTKRDEENANNNNGK